MIIDSSTSAGVGRRNNVALFTLFFLAISVVVIAFLEGIHNACKDIAKAIRSTAKEHGEDKT